MFLCLIDFKRKFPGRTMIIFQIYINMSFMLRRLPHKLSWWLIFFCLSLEDLNLFILASVGWDLMLASRTHLSIYVFSINPLDLLTIICRHSTPTLKDEWAKKVQWMKNFSIANFHIINTAREKNLFIDSDS